MEKRIDDGLALRLIEQALQGQVEAAELIHVQTVINNPPSPIPMLKVLVNDGPQWYELKLWVHSALDVTAEDDAERESHWDHRHPEA